MKAVIALTLSAVVAMHSFADDVKMFADARFGVKTWAKLESFDVRTLSKNRAFEGHVGRLVELRFQFRSKEIRHLKPNWYQSAVWQAAPEGKRGFVSVPVMIAEPDVKAFAAFTTDPRATADLKVYGQVLEDLSIDYVFVCAIGTNTFVDSDGYTNVTW
jgi:hypothetical protein